MYGYVAVCAGEEDVVGWHCWLLNMKRTVLGDGEWYGEKKGVDWEDGGWDVNVCLDGKVYVFGALLC